MKTTSYTKFQLQMIAIIGMTLNHIAHAFDFFTISPILYTLFIAAGMVTFPTMAFFLSEGFKYTSNRWKYLGRLALAGVISIYPFHLLTGAEGMIYPLNNIMFSLGIGLLMMMTMERLGRKFEILILFVALILASSSDWSILGPLFIYQFYRYQKNRISLTRAILTSFVISAVLLGFAVWSYYLAEQTGMVITEGTSFLMLLCDGLAMLGMLPLIYLLNRYNHQKGYQNKFWNYFFYLYYPLHLLILSLLAM